MQDNNFFFWAEYNNENNSVSIFRSNYNNLEEKILIKVVENCLNEDVAGHRAKEYIESECWNN